MGIAIGAEPTSYESSPTRKAPCDLLGAFAVEIYEDWIEAHRYLNMGNAVSAPRDLIDAQPRRDGASQVQLSFAPASGSLARSSGWSTILSPDSVTIIDALRIEVTPGGDAFTYIDNIVVNPATLSVPDAGSSLVLLGLALAGLIFARSFLRIGRISAA